LVIAGVMQLAVDPAVGAEETLLPISAISSSAA
jgi:hypothetical protein